jgi:hypothetical protein
MIEGRADFIRFFVSAKIAAYAGGAAESASTRPASHDLRYAEGAYEYVDTYLGGFEFIGEEAVWKNGAPLWGMNYYGYMLVAEMPEGFSHFLKESLKLVPAEAPYRGPETYSEGEFEYRCAWKGVLEYFTGREEIWWKGEEIYALDFHGGEIK